MLPVNAPRCSTRSDVCVPNSIIMTCTYENCSVVLNVDFLSIITSYVQPGLHTVSEDFVLRSPCCIYIAPFATSVQVAHAWINYSEGESQWWKRTGFKHHLKKVHGLSLGNRSRGLILQALQAISSTPDNINENNSANNNSTNNDKRHNSTRHNNSDISTH